MLICVHVFEDVAYMCMIDVFACLDVVCNVQERERERDYNALASQQV